MTALYTKVPKSLQSKPVKAPKARASQKSKSLYDIFGMRPPGGALRQPSRLPVVPVYPPKPATGAYNAPNGHKGRFPQTYLYAAKPKAAKARDKVWQGKHIIPAWPGLSHTQKFLGVFTINDLAPGKTKTRAKARPGSIAAILNTPVYNGRFPKDVSWRAAKTKPEKGLDDIFSRHYKPYNPQALSLTQRRLGAYTPNDLGPPRKLYQPGDWGYVGASFRNVFGKSFNHSRIQDFKLFGRYKADQTFDYNKIYQKVGVANMYFNDRLPPEYRATAKDYFADAKKLSNEQFKGSPHYREGMRYFEGITDVYMQTRAEHIDKMTLAQSRVENTSLDHLGYVGLYGDLAAGWLGRTLGNPLRWAPVSALAATWGGKIALTVAKGVGISLVEKSLDELLKENLTKSFDKHIND